MSVSLLIGVGLATCGIVGLCVWLIEVGIPQMHEKNHAYDLGFRHGLTGVTRAWHPVSYGPHQCDAYEAGVRDAACAKAKHGLPR